MMSDSENGGVALTEEQIQNAMGERVRVEGDAILGNRVEIEYSSSAGGSYGSDRPCTISGELLYVEEYGADSHQIVVRDDDGGRSVRFVTGSALSLKSLAARRTKAGTSLGKIMSVTFTDEDVSALAPVMGPIRHAIAGDTLCFEGEEYGVVSVTEYGPEKAPDKFSAILTTANGEEYVLEVSAAYTDASATFKRRFAGHSEKEDVDPSAVSSGRFRERYFDSDNEGLEIDGTTGAFPAPHGVREGERVTFTLTGGDTRDDHPEEQVSGVVTDVRYFSQKRSVWFGEPEEKDPETAVKLDDGRKVILQNASRRGHSHVTRSRREGMGDGGMVRAMVVTPREDADDEYAHVEAVDIQPEDASGGSERTDGGRVLTDGGEDEPEVVIPAGDSSADHYHSVMSPCSFQLSDSRTVPLHQAQSRGLDPCSSCEPPTTAGPQGNLRADGGQSPEALASAVSDHLGQSDIPLNRVSVSVGEVDGDVTVQGNGPMGREGWTDLREHITDALDDGGFTYRSKSQWAFVEVDGREAVTDGGVSAVSFAMAGVYSALKLSSSGGPVNVTRHSRNRCSITYSGPVGSLISEELDSLGLETEHRPLDGGSERGEIDVSGFSTGGGSDE